MQAVCIAKGVAKRSFSVGEAINFFKREELTLSLTLVGASLCDIASATRSKNSCSPGIARINPGGAGSISRTSGKNVAMHVRMLFIAMLGGGGAFFGAGWGVCMGFGGFFLTGGGSTVVSNLGLGFSTGGGGRDTFSNSKPEGAKCNAFFRRRSSLLSATSSRSRVRIRRG